MTELSDRAEEVTRVLNAMANAKRLMILCHLRDKEMTVGELAAAVDLAQSPLSQHLAKLRGLGLVETRRDGQLIYYNLASDEVAAVLATLHGLYCTVC